MSMHYVEVAPLVIFRHTSDSLTYSSNLSLEIGSMVVISIGTRSSLGIVIGLGQKKPSFEVKKISSKLDLPPLPRQLVATAKWMSRYYHVPLATALSTVLPTGLQKKRRSPPDQEKQTEIKRTNIVFTRDQRAALRHIDQLNGSILLHGVTGSGKTLVYIEQIRKSLKSGQSSIVLVPEISLTSQILDVFNKHFSNTLVVHSKQTESERHKNWLRCLTSKDPLVVIGPRSALFMPLKNVGTVVIDECHEPSYQQEQSPRYSALRVASVLAREHKAKLIMGSATPLATDYYMAKSKSQIVSMTKPARENTTKPDISIVDSSKRNNFRKHHFFSDKLLERLESSDEQNQSLVFHNRRGSTLLSLCNDCGWQAGCGRCLLPLTLHADSHELVCHLCGNRSRVPTVCPECNGVDIFHKGIGTKMIESELKRLFPNKTIARFDGDNNKLDRFENRYEEVRAGEVDIIIGTQVVAKGLDLPNLRTVAVIQADAGLFLPDFAASERTFQLIAQVVGRVGRSHHPTNVVIQSYKPDHPSIVDGLSQNYHDFYQRTLANRKLTKFPPYCFLLRLTCTYKTESTAIKNSKALADLLKQLSMNIEILGPTPAFHERIRNSFRWQIIVKSPNRQNLLDLLDHVPNHHWTSELDPISLL